MDAVGVRLYKRVWPRPAKLWTGEVLDDDPASRDNADVKMGMMEG